MPAVAFLVLLIGGWLLQSAIKNRGPITTLVEVLQNPSTARDTVKKSKAFTAPTALPAPFQSVADGMQATGERLANAASALNDGKGATPGTGPSVGGGTPGAAAAIAFARRQIGKPYLWGGNGPDSWDCSGLIVKAYGMKKRHTTATFIFLGRKVSRDELLPGDLVFANLGHIALCTGPNTWIEAPRAGLTVTERNMWGFLTARRM